jgi:hypothetical protein
MRHKLHFLSAIVLFSFAAAITPAASAAPPIDVCTLLTNAQISAVIGASVGTCEATLPGKIFTWTDTGNSGDAQRKLIVVVISMQGYEVGKTPANGVVKHPLTGVGDEAYSMSSRFATTIHFKTGDLAFSVEIRAKDLSADQLIVMEKSIGQQIVAKR